MIIGKDRQIALVIAALLAKGHVLLEDVPGTGKTMLACSLAASRAACSSGAVHAGYPALGHDGHERLQPEGSGV